MKKIVETGLLILIVGFFCSCQQPEEKTKYYPNGQIEEVCGYKNGIMDGTILSYFLII